MASYAESMCCEKFKLTNVIFPRCEKKYPGDWRGSLKSGENTKRDIQTHRLKTNLQRNG